MAMMLLSCAVLAACAGQPMRGELERGKAFMDQGRYQEAYDTLRGVYEQTPNNAEARAAFLSVRERLGTALLTRGDDAMGQKRWADAENLYGQASVIPGFGDRALGRMRTLQATINASQVASAVPSPPPDPFTQAMHKRVTLQFRDASIRSIFDVLAKTAGLNIIVDRDVPPGLKSTVFLNDTTVDSAIQKILMTSQLSSRQFDDNTLLIYPDQPAKQQDYQQLVVKSFHLGNADAKAVANSLRTVLKFRDVVVDDKLNMIVMRDTPEAIRMAEKLVALHDVPEPEVMLDVEILEVSRSLLQDLGVEWPAQLQLNALPFQLQSSGATSFDTTVPLTLRDLMQLTPGRVGATVGSLNINANATDGDVSLLANPRIRAKNREKAKILIGERVPNISSTATSTGFVSENINYVDVGLKLDVEPQVFADNQVVIKLALEVSNILDTTQTKSGTLAYRIGTRNASTVLRLKDGENQILAGLIQDEDTKSLSKVPALGDIPILGRLFGSQHDEKKKTEIVLSITPHLIRAINRPDSSAGQFDAGTVTGLRGHRPENESNGGADAVLTAPESEAAQASGNLQRQNAPQGNGNNNGGAAMGSGRLRDEP
ncbi:MAG: secretin N-terminal domain-containing protein [Rhodocyclaceae bacterium]